MAAIPAEIPDIESHGFQKEKATGDVFQVNRGQTQRWSSGMDLRDERPPTVRAYV